MQPGRRRTCSSDPRPRPPPRRLCPVKGFKNLKGQELDLGQGQGQGLDLGQV